MRVFSTLHANARLGVQEYQTTSLHVFRAHQNCAEEVGAAGDCRAAAGGVETRAGTLAAEAKALGLGLRMEVRSTVTDGLATAATDSVQAV